MHCQLVASIPKLTPAHTTQPASHDMFARRLVSRVALRPRASALLTQVGPHLTAKPEAIVGSVLHTSAAVHARWGFGKASKLSEDTDKLQAETERKAQPAQDDHPPYLKLFIFLYVSHLFAYIPVEINMDKWPEDVWETYLLFTSHPLLLAKVWGIFAPIGMVAVAFHMTVQTAVESRKAWNDLQRASDEFWKPFRGKGSEPSTPTKTK